MTSYILGETPAETQRLVAQAATDPLEDVAVWAGLRPGMHVVDAGCGPGVFAHRLARLVGPAGTVRGFDVSPARIEAAGSLAADPSAGQVSFALGDVYDPPFPPASADFVLCQFVFEYLGEPDRAVTALRGLLRPGGILLLRDADGNGQTIWPLPENVEGSLPKMFAAMARTGFDPYSGRKLFHRLYGAGLTQLDARVDARVTAGLAPPDELSNWRQRLDALSPLGAEAFGSREAYDDAARAYLAMLHDEGTLRFMNYVSVRGVSG